jgi:phosphate starvation-inducible PhoH-like protein
MRGRTFENTLIIADEMQNATANQVLMLLTRVGVNTKIILTGDLEQSDLGPENGLKELLYAMQLHDLRYIEHTELCKSDVVRHPAVKEVLNILKK